MRKGAVCEVVDVSEARRKLPFAKGAIVTIAEVRAHTGGRTFVQLRGIPGFYAAHRFAVRADG